MSAIYPRSASKPREIYSEWTLDELVKISLVIERRWTNKKFVKKKKNGQTSYSLRPQILLFLADFRKISVANKRPFYPQLIWVPPFNHAR